MWSPLQPSPGWLTECCIRNWNQTGGSGPSEPWQQAVNLSNESFLNSDLKSRTHFESNMSTGFEKLVQSDPLSAFPSRICETKNLSFSYGGLKQNGSERLEYGTAVFSRAEETPSCLINPAHQSILKDAQSSQEMDSVFFPAVASQAHNQTNIFDVRSQKLSPQDVAGNLLLHDFDNGRDSSCHLQIRNDKLVDERSKKELLGCSWREILSQQTSSGSNYVITPLFEKRLTVSDAGRVGRLVLPKKYAESYLPPISKSEGLPLKVQDVKGKEWIFQFRFWVNNNSRIYVLEGIANWIQSVQLQAGDVVTFGRVEPEGKLMMGFKKASTGSQNEQGTRAVQNGDKMPKGGNVGNQKPNRIEDLSCQSKVKEAIGTNSSFSHKRKNTIPSSKAKRSRVNCISSSELNLTLKEVQGLFRSPVDHAPHVELIEDFEFEEYEDAPLIGRPPITAEDSVGKRVQWVQCDNCLKWRKLPFDYVLPAKWICSKNLHDPDRSSCGAAQEPISEQLKHKSTNKPAAPQKLTQDVNTILNDFASFSIGDSETVRPTTKHPRHRQGCSCIVCVQPPSGKSPKHHQNCTCKVCLMVKRRLQTMMSRRERSQSVKKAATKELEVQHSSKYFTTIGHIDLNINPEREGEGTIACSNSKHETKKIPNGKSRGGKSGCERQSFVSHSVEKHLSEPLVHPSTSSAVTG